METIRTAEVAARRLIDAHLTLGVIPKSEHQAKDIFKRSKVLTFSGVAGKKYFGVIIDPGQMGETVTAPHVRIPPLQVDELKLFTRVLLEVRAPPAGNQLAAYDMFFVFDNHHPMNLTKCSGIFVNSDGDRVPKQEYNVTLTYDKESQRARKTEVRDAGALTDQLEVMRIVTQNVFADMGLPQRSRLGYPGTNMGNKIGDVVLMPYATQWQEACIIKHAIHGSKRQAVGGKTDGEDDIGRGQKRKTLDTIEPVLGYVLGYLRALCITIETIVFDPIANDHLASAH